MPSVFVVGARRSVNVVSIPMTLSVFVLLVAGV